MNPRTTFASSVPSSGGRVAANASIAVRVCGVAGLGSRGSSDTEGFSASEVSGDRLADRLIGDLGDRLVVVASQLEATNNEMVDLIRAVGEP